MKKVCVYVTIFFTFNQFFFSDPSQNEEVFTFNEIKIENTQDESEEQLEVLEESDLIEEGRHDHEEYEDLIEEELQPEHESDEKDIYTCNLCQVNFYSIEDHVAQYHKDEQVIVEVEEPAVEEGTSDEKQIKIELDSDVIYDEEYLIDEILPVPELKKEKITIQKPKVIPKAIPKVIPKAISMAIPKKRLCYSCPLCPAKYSNSRAVTAHIKIHNNLKPSEPDALPECFECDVCNTVFATNKSLRLHVRMHDPVKPRTLEDATDYDATAASNANANTEMFTCDVCNKTYDVQFREMHILSHSDEPKFNCTICNRKFKNEVNLSMHFKAHQEAKVIPSRTEKTNTPYACGYCGRQFTRPHEKVKHERIHTGEKPHVS